MRRVSLSPIELSILKMLANGMQSKEVAAVLKRSTSTIEFHVRMLLGKFDARSRAHLVACAIYDGSIGSEDFEGVSSDAVS